MFLTQDPDNDLWLKQNIDESILISGNAKSLKQVIHDKKKELEKEEKR